MSYKWTIQYVDEQLTWPQIKGLLDVMKEYPPVDLFLFRMLKGTEKQKPAIQDGSKMPKMTGHIPIKKGKIGKLRRVKHGN